MENKSTKEIVEEAYVTEDEETYWELIQLLHKRGTVIEFKQAVEFCESCDPIKREIGADILGQLGLNNRPFHEEAVQILIGLLNDANSGVISSAAYALGHRKSATAIAVLLRHKNHPNARVRHGIVFGLLAHKDQNAIKGLIELSEDDDDDVRNWATFGLGSMIDTDSPNIRQALERRLEDCVGEIRGEAYVGLAKRGCSSIVDGLNSELSKLDAIPLMLEAAELLKNSRLYANLEKIYQSLNDEDSDYYRACLVRALENCKQG